MKDLVDLEKNIATSIDVSSIVEQGLEIRERNKLRRATLKFLLVASLLSTIIGFIYIRVSIPIIASFQFAGLLVLLSIYTILQKQRLRRDAM